MRASIPSRDLLPFCDLTRVRVAVYASPSPFPFVISLSLFLLLWMVTSPRIASIFSETKRNLATSVRKLPLDVLWEPDVATHTSEMVSRIILIISLRKRLSIAVGSVSLSNLIPKYTLISFSVGLTDTIIASVKYFFTSSAT